VQNFLNNIYTGEYMFTVHHKEGQARVGTLKTNHGEVETPFFMPVATKAVGKMISTDDYQQINTKTIICNAFLLAQHPGLETFEEIDGIHNFMSYNDVIFTDCGGFQMLRDNLLEGTTNNGIWFKNEQGKKVFIRPETVMRIGKAIKSDVIMALDCVLPYGRTKEEYQEALEKSLRWTKVCKDIHDGKRLLFGITQGGIHDDLRIGSAKAINAMGFDGHAIGGVAIGEAYDQMFRVIEVSTPHLDENKPRYLMGVGKPDQILECIERGIDIFDSILPQKNARHGRLFTYNGLIDLGQARYKFDTKPIEEGCKCPTCQQFSRAYVRYLLKKNDAVGKRYLSIHNIYFMQDFMSKIRRSIKEGTFTTFKQEFLQTFQKI